MARRRREKQNSTRTEDENNRTCCLERKERDVKESRAILTLEALATEWMAVSRTEKGKTRDRATLGTGTGGCRDGLKRYLPRSPFKKY